MAKPKQKKFTIAQATKDVKKYDTKVKITFPDNTYLHIYPYISPPRLQEMCINFGEFIAEYEKRNLGELTEAKILNYYYLHLIKYFSSLSEEIPDDFDTKVQVFNYLAEHEYTGQIIESFDEKELVRALDMLTKIMETSLKLIDQNKELRKEYIEKLKQANLQNPEILNLLGVDNNDNASMDETVRSTN